MTVDLKCEMIRPFAPSILRIVVPSVIIKNVNDFADNQQNKKNMKHRLVSRIEDVPQLTNETLEHIGIKTMFEESCRHYLQSVKGNINVDVKIISAWFNNQIEDEYNPVHFHHSCKLSAVLYLKIPENKDRGFDNDIDGNIDFIYGTSDYSGLFVGNFCHKPMLGDLLIFPSSLFHTVYPFKGKGTRRTLAFNVDFQIIDGDLPIRFLGHSE